MVGEVSFSFSLVDADNRASLPGPYNISVNSSLQAVTSSVIQVAIEFESSNITVIAFAVLIFQY